ncbi:MAG TPA: hypothetical protein VH540_00485 [Ktedonobacterales bacterium]|jgi:hypothetical protein
MSALDWVLATMLFMIYMVCLVTVCMLTFKKGYLVLGIVGIFFPLLWLIGAILPPKRGSRYEVEESIRLQRNVQQMTG